MTRIVGLDLSLASTGIAIVDIPDQGDPRTKVQRHKSTGRKDATLLERAMRLHNLRLDLGLIATSFQNPDDELTTPDLIVVEAPSFGQMRQAGQHDRAGLWWLVVDWWMSYTSDPLPVVEVQPAIVKKYATGKGNAAKDEVLAAVVRRYPTVNVTGNDEADALVLAAIGARHYGHPIDDMPKAHLDALAKIRWPVDAAGGELVQA